MSSVQYALNIGLLAYILGSNLGTHRLTRSRLLLPIALVGVVAWFFLQNLPTLGHDVQLELVGVGVGVALGVLAGLLVKVRPGRTDTVVTHAGAAYAALWVVVIGGRVAFAYGAEHWFPVAIGRFSMNHQITGADAWTAAFVLMALAMVLVRVVVTALRAWTARSSAVTQAVAA
jgi:hypothetical protein